MEKTGSNTETSEKLSEAQFQEVGDRVLRALVDWVAVAIARRNSHALMMMQANVGNLFRECERTCREINDADGIEFESEKTTVQ